MEGNVFVSRWAAAEPFAGKCDILIGPTGIIGESLNLTRGTFQVNLEPAGNWSTARQMEGRLRRCGQTKVVHIYTLLVNKYRLEEQMLWRQQAQGDFVIRSLSDLGLEEAEASQPNIVIIDD